MRLHNKESLEAMFAFEEQIRRAMHPIREDGEALLHRMTAQAEELRQVRYTCVTPASHFTAERYESITTFLFFCSNPLPKGCRRRLPVVGGNKSVTTKLKKKVKRINFIPRGMISRNSLQNLIRVRGPINRRY